MSLQQTYTRPLLWAQCGPVSHALHHFLSYPSPSNKVRRRRMWRRKDISLDSATYQQDYSTKLMPSAPPIQELLKPLLECIYHVDIHHMPAKSILLIHRSDGKSILTNVFVELWCIHINLKLVATSPTWLTYNLNLIASVLVTPLLMERFLLIKKLTNQGGLEINHYRSFLYSSKNILPKHCHTILK